MNTLKFSQLMCSRLCHDLITPVGAISNGFELLEECEEEDRQGLVDVTRQSAANAVRRLRFFRAAFGYSAHPTFDEVKKTIDVFLKPINIDFQWSEVTLYDQQDLPSRSFPLWERLIMNCILIGADGMPYGGEIKLTGVPASHQVLKFSFTGKLAMLRPELIKALEGKLTEEEETAHTIQGILIKMLADSLGLDLKIHAPDKQHFDIMISWNEAKLPLQNTGTL